MIASEEDLELQAEPRRTLTKKGNKLTRPLGKEERGDDRHGACVGWIDGSMKYLVVCKK